MSSSRRRFLQAAAAASLAGALPSSPFEENLQAQSPGAAGAAQPAPGAREAESSSYVLVTSANGVEAAKTARQALIQGHAPLDAAIAGVNVVELDPNDVSVGYGGIPNEEGVVQLDAAVMDGRTMKVGAVGALEGVKTPSKVAKLVMDRTDRVFLVGAGARAFATVQGFPVEDLLTEKTRKIWRYWKERMSDIDDWEVSAKEAEDPDVKWFLEKYGQEIFRPQGTIHMSVRSAPGDFACVTTTSGLFFKMPGRVGDSPVVGAGLYCENGVGSAGSTGRGEANLEVAGAHTIVELLRQGKGVEEACLGALRRIDEKIHLVPRHRDAKGRPRFNVSYYAIDAKGRTAGASIWSGTKHVVADDAGVRTVESAYLYKKDK
ncbi:MAG TPA: N(4)-(beta-N-acetylglucosaminyl)-L-asparaginase [Thermoanaerobaculia bacterium]|nr:N(4)-(beta-N-acetylglucosaminyl)-L-asparaginase [Thermoanaerobaculia bacterium]